MPSDGPLYLGFDLSTQQLKAIAVTSDLKKTHEVKFDFDADSSGFGIHKGVLTNEAEHEVFAPVALWLRALDSILERLKEDGLDFAQVQGISGAGMQHGSVFWNANAERLLSSLDSSKPLQHQLEPAFSHPYSPNWQDASTQAECDEFDTVLGDPQTLAQITGSKAHHRFTGPQILRFRRKHPDAYHSTARISLVSSFLASLFLGHVAPIDIADVCGMNLWDIAVGEWHEKLLSLAAGSTDNAADLEKKLGSIPTDGGAHLGPISSYFVQRYNFSPDCTIIAFTGDNPSTILSLPLRPNDAIVSLGTSTTFLMSTPEYRPDRSTHFFNHPTTPGLYMFMLCYKNGGLAREEVRDEINRQSRTESTTWERFNHALLACPPLAQSSPTEPMRLGLFFPRPEIVPPMPAGEWHFHYHPGSRSTTKLFPPDLDPVVRARLIVESQLLSLRLRSRNLVTQPQGTELPPQPNRIYLVGGGSANPAIAKLVGEILGSSEGIYRLDVGGNACALGAAYKAVWAVERQCEQGFEDLIGQRWHARSGEGETVEKVADGCQAGLWERYGLAVEGLERVETELLGRYK